VTGKEENLAKKCTAQDVTAWPFSGKASASGSKKIYHKKA
jgi:hypothetical protein